MYQLAISQTYLGKSNISIKYPSLFKGIKLKEEPELSPFNLIGDILIPTSFKNTPEKEYEPDYFIYGTWYKPRKKTPGEFILDVQGRYTLTVTGVDLNSNITPFCFQQCVHRTYFKDNHRGYLFQIIESRELKHLPLYILPSYETTNLH